MIQAVSASLVCQQVPQMSTQLARRWRQTDAVQRGSRH
jgi:hypothetical protein